MSGPCNDAPRFVANLEALYEELVQAVRGWAGSLGTASNYYDSRLEEGGSNDWAGRLQKATEDAMKTVVSLLTAHGRVDVATDLRQRFESLYARAQGYQHRLEALEDQRRVHVEGLAARYRREFPDDADLRRLAALCRGPQREWTLCLGDNPMETPEQFAEAIDKASWEEEGGKLKAQCEMMRLAGDLAEHIEVLCSVTGTANIERATETNQKPPKRGKRGPARMPLAEAWRYLTIAQEWAGIQERNRKLSMRDRVRKVQLAAKHGITTRELDAMLAWYAKHLREKRFPEDPRTLSRGELEKWFE